MRAAVDRLRSEWRMLARVVQLRPFDTATSDGRSRERYRRIVLTAASGLGVRGAGAAIGLVTVPLVLGYLGKERYGLWSTITTLVAWAALLDFGIASGLVNLIARAHGRDDRAEAARSFSTALATLLAVAAALAVVLLLSVRLVPWATILAVRGAVDPDTVTWSVAAALGMFVVGLPLSVVPQIYAGYQKMHVANGFALLGMLAGFAALLAALRRGVGMPALVVLFGAGALIGSFLALLYAMRFALPWLRFRPSLVSAGSLQQLMGRSFPIFLFQIGALTVNETQAIILAHRCDLATVADYAVVMRVYILLVGLVQVSTQSFVPSFREARERRDLEWARRSFRWFTLLRVGGAAAGGAVLVAAGNPLLRFWLRRPDVVFPPALWAALAAMLVATAWVSVHSDLLVILDRLWIQVALVAGNAAVTVALTFWLSPRLGVLGVVLATGAVTVLCFSWLLPALARPLLRG